ncbi:MAG: hypothetical protein M1816_000050 [Peltula sp. TS41687]|nr:MAG: hypothetical protein M1816_000050 [Peltula sp. TS41687]
MPPFVPRKRPRNSSPSDKGSSTPSKKPTLFDALEGTRARRTVEDNQAYLDRLEDDDSDESSLSDIDSSDFEDVEPATSSKRRKIEKHKENDEDDEDDDDVQWEDAVAGISSGPSLIAPEPSGDLELTLDDSARSYLTIPNGKKKGPSKTERLIRIQTHCLQVQFLLFHNLVRNGWVIDKEVQSILVGQLNPKLKKEVERWRAASGMNTSAESAESDEKDSADEVARKRNEYIRRGRDWGKQAEKVEIGAPNLSRGDPLIRLLKVLSAYWRKRFTITAPGLRKQGYKPLSQLEVELKSFQNDPHSPEEHGERIENLAAFRELAKKCQGSRDVGAQLFTALLRGLGIEARMVASLQPLGFGWSKAEEASVKQRKRKSGEAAEINDEEDDSNEEGENSNSDDPISDGRNRVPPKRKKPTVAASEALPGRDQLRNMKRSITKPRESASQADVMEISDEDDLSVVETIPWASRRTQSNSFDKDLKFPVYWTEVLSPITQRYIPVDPLILNTIACNPELVASFEPRGSKAEKSKQVIAYVIGYSSDGTAKDVTVRYLKRRTWPGKTKGVRLGVEKIPIYNQRGKVKKYEDFDWFKTVIGCYARDGRLRTLSDDIENQHDLEPVKPARQGKAGEETLQGYKSSTEFVLERHLRREEALVPGATHVKTFTTGKGDKAAEEMVYLRKDVVNCKTVESWHKEGRELKPGEVALKMVPIRAVTLTRKREIEQAEAAGEKVQQGLYAIDQTTWIVPPPIENGIIPTNAFGNIDCFVPSMVPKGAVHLPLRGMTKICRRLNISYAEAVIGFEFKSKRAVPIIQGVVVPEGAESVLMEQWQADEVERIRKEDGKREKMSLNLWRKFLMGLRIFERVREEYGGDDVPDEVNPFTNRNKQKTIEHKATAEQDLEVFNGDESNNPELGGGFMIDDQTDSNIGGTGFCPLEKEKEVESSAPKQNSPLPKSGLSSLQGKQDRDSDDENSVDGDDDNVSEEMDPKSRRRRRTNNHQTALQKDNARVNSRSRLGLTPKSTTRDKGKRIQIKQDIQHAKIHQSSTSSATSFQSPGLASLGLNGKYLPAEETEPGRDTERRRTTRGSETVIKSRFFNQDGGMSTHGDEQEEEQVEKRPLRRSKRNAAPKRP